MKRQLMAMVLTVSSAMTDEAAKAPIDVAAKPRQHAVDRRHSSHVSAAEMSVCEMTVQDRFDARNISSADAYFYSFDH